MYEKNARPAKLKVWKLTANISIVVSPQAFVFKLSLAQRTLFVIASVSSAIYSFLDCFVVTLLAMTVKISPQRAKTSYKNVISRCLPSILNSLFQSKFEILVRDRKTPRLYTKISQIQTMRYFVLKKIIILQPLS